MRSLGSMAVLKGLGLGTGGSVAALIAAGALSPLVTFSRASTARYSDLTLAAAAVDAPRFQSAIGGVFTADEIAAANSAARAASAPSTTADRSSLLALDRALLLSYGQSNSCGTEAWPARTKVAQAGCYMMGNSEHPQSTTGAWATIGTAQLNPLVGTVKNGTTGLLDDAGVAALTPGDSNLGESPLIGMTSEARRRYLAAGGSASTKWVAASCGVGGRSIEELSGTFRSDLTAVAPLGSFARLTQAMQQHKALADAAGENSGVLSVLFAQGEDNFSKSNGTNDEDTYLALLEQWRADLWAAVQSVFPGQTVRPLIMVLQTSGNGVVTSGFSGTDLRLSIANAQRRFAEANEDVHIVGPNYPVTEKGIHWDSNGTRQMGMFAGRDMADALMFRKKKTAFRAHSVQWRGAEVLISFRVPVAPIRFSDVYYILTATDYATKGFDVFNVDGLTAATISKVEIVGSHTVRITCASALSGTVQVAWGRRTTFIGNTNLKDSAGVINPSPFGWNYEYAAGSGDYAGANIAALVGNPYPSDNWALIEDRAAVAA